MRPLLLRAVTLLSLPALASVEQVATSEQDRLAGFTDLGCGTPQVGIFGETTTVIANSRI